MLLNLEFFILEITFWLSVLVGIVSLAVEADGRGCCLPLTLLASCPEQRT